MKNMEIKCRGYLYKFFAFLMIIILITGCTKITDTTKKDDSKTKIKNAAVPIPTFSSCTAIVDAFKSQTNNRMYDYEIMGGVQSIGAPTAAPVATKTISDSIGSTDYSQTNVQVQGVDEADIVKTDGKYIYVISKGKLFIADAYPAENAKIISEVNLKNLYPHEMFIGDNSVLIFGQTQIDYPRPLPYETRDTTAVPGSTAPSSVAPSSGSPSSEIAPDYYPYYSSFTTLQLWDVSDKENPKIARSIDFEGNYASSRKINSTAYFVINSYPNYYIMGNMMENNKNEQDKILPLYRENNAGLKPVTGCGDVGYLEPIQPSAFTIIGSISMKDYDAAIEKEVVVASGQNVYASDKNLYLAEVNYNYRPMPLGKSVPTMPIAPGGRAMPIIDSGYSEEETKVHKFALEDGDIDYLGSMDAPGRILNQFSMDEFNDHFRIATTTGHVSRGGGDSSNNIYVFDDKLKIVGKLEDLAPGEQIHSTRFMGKKVYMVTFKKVDPLFVIDLSNPEYPKVLGKLKIPGYSDYLHPIDENHIIGLGKEAVEAEEGDFAWYQGIKMAVFDVSDVEHPKEMHKVVIGDRGTDSYALQDHKAFLYDKDKNLLVIPVLLAEIDETKYAGKLPSNAYGDFVFQGAYVYDLTLEKGFKLKGRITHVDSDDQSFKKAGYYYNDYGNAIKRSLYINNVLYTISDNKILANALDDLDLIKEIELKLIKEPESYIACGCGCCTFDKPLEEIAKIECLYKSKDESIQDKIEQDNKLSPELCARAGCSFPIKYVYCD